MSVRVRFAPSPTGALHVGGARTALFNFLFAKKQKGQFIVRIEDTDQARNQESFLKEQLEALQWLGLNWDEGVEYSDLFKSIGEYGPYRQSQRLSIYKKYADLLLEKNKAYYCFLTDEEIDQQKKEASQTNQAFRVASPYREWSIDKALEKKKTCPFVIRFKIPPQKKMYQIDDGVRGLVSFPSDMVGDFILIRSNGLPVYNFCCAVDDALMKITHVFRAEEHLANTLRQLMVLDALDWDAPRYFHLSLILDKNKKKLSKRSGALPCLEYKKQGYLPESLNNFFVLLGWSAETSQEIFCFSELIQHFSEKRLNPSAAVFDEEKLKWMNAYHIRHLPHEKLWQKLHPLLQKENLSLSADWSWIDKALNNLKDSFSNLNEAVEVFRLFDSRSFSIHSECIKIKEWPSSELVIKMWKQFLDCADQSHISVKDFKSAVQNIKTELKVSGKFLFMPIRVSMIGRLQGLELNSTIELLHKDVLLKRTNQVLSQLFAKKLT